MLHNLGRVVATAAVAAVVPRSLITALLDRHAAGDWGDLDADDKAANEEAAARATAYLFSRGFLRSARGGRQQSRYSNPSTG